MHDNNEKKRITADRDLRRACMDYEKINEHENIYDKDKKEDGICIVVKGTENGKFWDREEWERENGKIE